MLIVTDRHTAADLELWAEYEEMDAIEASSPWLGTLEERAIETIQQFSARYIGISYGKDSVVAWHLAYRAGCQAPPVHVIQRPTENPDGTLVRETLAARFGMCVSEYVADYTDLSQDSPHYDDETDKIFSAAFARVARDHGRQYISGVRSEESVVRRIRQAKFGETSFNTCAPITRWKTKHVYAYLYKYDLPVHPSYGMLGGGRWPRERLRVDGIGGLEGRGGGRLEWEREYYPDILARIASIQSKRRKT